MINIFQNRIIKLLLIMGAAYFVADFSGNNVFLANTPKVNPFFARNMTAKIRNNLSNGANFVAGLNPFNRSALESERNTNNMPVERSFNQQVAEAINAPLAPLSQGVYAGEQEGVNVYEVRIGELEYLEHTFIIKGKEVKIRVPKGQEAPSEDVIEYLYKYSLDF